MTYAEDDYLHLSDIQHFAFCRRQWALMQIERQWADNWRTVDGTVMHERAHNEKFGEKRNGVFTANSLRVSSRALGLSGQCDVVEFHAGPDGVAIHGRTGRWLPFPVEYKRGRAKIDDCDRLQLCAQAMCLEEMLACSIERGALFYGAAHRREQIEFTTGLREKVFGLAKEMHEAFERKRIPEPRRDRKCKECSLVNLCLPRLVKSASKYMEDALCESC